MERGLVREANKNSLFFLDSTSPLLLPVCVILVIVKKSCPKKLSADCRSTVGRQLTDRLPTVYRQLTNRLPTG